MMPWQSSGRSHRRSSKFWGVTTIFGNAATAVTTRNALTLVETVGRPDVSVVAGASKPLPSDYLGPIPQVHGINGLGDAVLVTPTASIVSDDAAGFIYATACANQGEVTLVALGPLTNLATALQRHPDLPERVDEVIIMGGNALVPGNATPVAEANINIDPEAADLVFGAPCVASSAADQVATGKASNRAAVGSVGRGASG